MFFAICLQKAHQIVVKNLGHDFRGVRDVHIDLFRVRFDWIRVAFIRREVRDAFDDDTLDVIFLTDIGDGACLRIRDGDVMLFEF